MADPISNDPRRPAPTADNRAAAAPTAGRSAPPSQPAPGTDAVNSALDQFHETHMRNSDLSQNTALYNEAQGHLRALRETFSKLNPPSQRVAENQDAFRSGSDNVSV